MRLHLIHSKSLLFDPFQTSIIKVEDSPFDCNLCMHFCLNERVLIFIRGRSYYYMYILAIKVEIRIVQHS